MKKMNKIISMTLVLLLLVTSSNLNNLVHAWNQEQEDAVNVETADAYNRIEAETGILGGGAALEPVLPTEDSGGGEQVKNTIAGSNVKYEDVDFGTTAPESFSVRVSVKGSNAGGTIEIIVADSTSTDMNDPSAVTIGTLHTEATAPDNWDVYETQYCTLDPVAATEAVGVKDVYLNFIPDAGKTYVSNVNWIQFNKELTGLELTSPPTKTTYGINEPLALSGLVVTGTYIDGSTRQEQVWLSDVSGFDSSTAVTGQVLTINVRGNISLSFTVDVIQLEVGSVDPIVITGIENGMAPTPLALGLPRYVMVDCVSASDPNITVQQELEVYWDIEGSGYDFTNSGAQTFTVNGDIQLINDILNPNNIQVKATVTVDAAVDPTVNDDYVMTFAAYSDSHYKSDPNAAENQRSKNAFDEAKWNGCELITLTGDITQDANAAEYDQFQADVATGNYPPIYGAMGNHDVRWKGSFDTALQTYYEGMDGTSTPDEIYYDIWWEPGVGEVPNPTDTAYHFIFLATESDNKDSAYISQEQLAWFEATIAEGSSLDKPIFVFLHQPLNETVSWTYDTETYEYVSDDYQDQQVKDILGQYPQSVLITGHLHDTLTDEGTLYNEQYCTMVRDGSIGESNSGSVGKSEGLIIDVYENKIVITGRDFTEQTTIAQWTINLFTDENLVNDTEAPSQPQNLTTTYLTDEAVAIEWDVATDNFENNVGVVGYDIYMNGELVSSTSGRTDIEITGLEPNTTYTFTVTAKDAAGNVSTESHPLTITTLPEMTLENVAEDALVTSSGSNVGYDDTNVVDNDSTTKWSYGDTHGYDPLSPEKWLQIDLGGVYTIYGYEIKNAGIAGEAGSLNTKDVRVECSVDGESWEELDYVENNASDVISRRVEPKDARYLKFTFEEPSNCDAGPADPVNIYEIEVYADIN